MCPSSRILFLVVIAITLGAGGCRHAGASQRSQTLPGNPYDPLGEQHSNTTPTDIDQSDGKHSQGGGRGGVIDGNTGELITTEYNPWFLDHEPIAYCIEFADDFSLRKDVAESAISEAFETWEKVLDGLTSFDVSWTSIDLPRALFPMKVSSRYSRVDCRNNPSLVFKLGVIDADIRAALAFTAKHTLGFAKRSDYDLKTGQARGYIWIAPDVGLERYIGRGAKEKFWSRQHQFYNVISHEIGHILGMKHEKNTLMDPALPANVVSSDTSWKWSGVEYQWTREFPGDFCGKIEAGDSDMMEYLFGVKLIGKVTMCSKYEPESNREGAPFVVNLTVKTGEDIIAVRQVKPKLFNGDRRAIAGQFLKKGLVEGSDLVNFEFAEYFLASSFKGEMTVGTTTVPILIERDNPLVFSLRFPHAGQWKLLVWQHPTGAENLFNLHKVLESP